MESQLTRSCFSIPMRQQDAIRDLHEQTGLGMSELVRRMFDFCLSQPTLNQLVPNMSGQIHVGGK